MEVKLNRHLVIEFRPISGIGYIFGPSWSLWDYVNKSKTAIPTTLEGIGDNRGRLHPQLGRMDGLLPYRPFGYNSKGNQENCYILLLIFGWNIYLLLGRHQNGVGIIRGGGGVGFALNSSSLHPWLGQHLTSGQGHERSHIDPIRSCCIFLDASWQDKHNENTPMYPAAVPNRELFTKKTFGYLR